MKTKNPLLWLSALMVALFAAMFVVAQQCGLAPVDHMAGLQLCIEWFEGVTGHADGLSILTATAPVVTAPLALTTEQFDELKRSILESAKPTQEGVADQVRTLATQDAPQEGGAIRTVEIVPPAKQGADVKVGNQRDIDGDGVYRATYQLLRAITKRDDQGVAKVQFELARAGHFGEERQADAMKQERAVMLTSSEGTPFLPTTVMNKVEDIMKQYGVARRVCTVVNNLIGSTKIPNVSGRFDAFAVNESSIIKGRKAAFSSQTLDPKKWGVIVPWSNEMSEEVGAQVVQKIMQLAGEAFAKAEDQTVFTADGTATYHSLTGLLESGSVPSHTLAVASAFTSLDYDDLIDMRTEVAPGIRARGTYVFHPDFEDHFAKLKDGNGAYIFGAGRAAEGIARVAGRAVSYTEVMPSLGDTAASTPFGLFGDFSFVTVGFQRNLTAALLTEATIQDVDDSTLIHLASQDSQALRFTAMWDVKAGLAASAVSKVATGAAS